MSGKKICRGRQVKKVKGEFVMKNLSLVMLGAALGFGTMALTGGGASAGALQPLAEQNVADDDIILVAQGDRDRRMRTSWDRRRDGRRCSERLGNCRHFHDGYYYETPWWTLPLIVGGSVAADRYYDDYDDDYEVAYGSSHVEWCLDRYRSYNPSTNTWVSFSGEVHECVSPY
jgi:hypothetical protein